MQEYYGITKIETNLTTYRDQLYREFLEKEQKTTTTQQRQRQQQQQQQQQWWRRRRRQLKFIPMLTQLFHGQLL
jgi:hypothetical protein